MFLLSVCLPLHSLLSSKDVCPWLSLSLSLLPVLWPSGILFLFYNLNMRSLLLLWLSLYFLKHLLSEWVWLWYSRVFKIDPCVFFFLAPLFFPLFPPSPRNPLLILSLSPLPCLFPSSPSLLFSLLLLHSVCTLMCRSDRHMYISLLTYKHAHTTSHSPFARTRSLPFCLSHAVLVFFT